MKSVRDMSRSSQPKLVLTWYSYHRSCLRAPSSVRWCTGCAKFAAFAGTMTQEDSAAFEFMACCECDICHEPLKLRCEWKVQSVVLSTWLERKWDAQAHEDGFSVFWRGLFKCIISSVAPKRQQRSLSDSAHHSFFTVPVQVQLTWWSSWAWRWLTKVDSEGPTP